DVYASRSGRVVFCAPSFRNYGKAIIIDHGDGFSSVYSGNMQLFASAGDDVRKGAVIAKSNTTGRQPYLHFEIRKGHLAQNPKFYLSD
ncbi:MAG: M23 family metallopeptidase, partial [Candidatus Omnitrophica bacterium]|nr:M23 family metallopeptidase [Candidatus Omnitrophota bacterium]